MMFDLDLEHVGSIASATAVVGGGGLVVAQWWASTKFARLGHIAKLDAKITELEKLLRDAPVHEDVVDLERRLNALEVAVGEMRADLRGVREGIGRVEHMMTLLLENELRHEGASHVVK